MEICEEEVMRCLVGAIGDPTVGAVLQRVGEGKEDPYHAALEILGDRDRLATILASRGGA